MIGIIIAKSNFSNNRGVAYDKSDAIKLSYFVTHFTGYKPTKDEVDSINKMYKSMYRDFIGIRDRDKDEVILTNLMNIKGLSLYNRLISNKGNDYRSQAEFIYSYYCINRIITKSIYHNWIKDEIINMEESTITKKTLFNSKRYKIDVSKVIGNNDKPIKGLYKVVLIHRKQDSEMYVVYLRLTKDNKISLYNLNSNEDKVKKIIDNILDSIYTPKELKRYIESIDIDEFIKVILDNRLNKTYKFKTSIVEYVTDVYNDSIKESK